MNRSYKIYVMVDDHNFDLKNIKNEFKNIYFLKINGKKCIDVGLGVVNPVIPKDCVRPSAWNKAIYYFSYKNMSFENIWFIEDDVFLCDFQTVLDIDSKHIGYDLLTASHNINNSGSIEGWVWWKTIPHYLSKPWAHSMVCACRVSQKLLLIVKEFALVHKTEFGLLFIEFIFNTLALHHNLQVKTIEELACILAVKSWDVSEINANHLYHPVKDITLHDDWRTRVRHQMT